MSNDPVTDTSKILDTKTFLDDAIAAAVKAASTPNPQPAKAGTGTLILYDAGDAVITDDIPALEKLYPGGIPKGVKTWRDLTAALSSHQTIATLVLFFHSAAGKLLFDGSPKPQEVKARLAASKAKVTGAIRFEGCNIMRAPVTAAYMVSGIAGSVAVVSGYTYYSIFNAVKVTPGLSLSEAKKVWDPYAPYWVDRSLSPEKLVAIKTAMTLWQRWFRVDLDVSPLPEYAGHKVHVPLSKLEEKTVTPAGAVKLQQELDSEDTLVIPAARVTVGDIAATAAKFPLPTP